MRRFIILILCILFIPAFAFSQKATSAKAKSIADSSCMPSQNLGRIYLAKDDTTYHLGTGNGGSTWIGKKGIGLSANSWIGTSQAYGWTFTGSSIYTTSANVGIGLSTPSFPIEIKPSTLIDPIQIDESANTGFYYINMKYKANYGCGLDLYEGSSRRALFFWSDQLNPARWLWYAGGDNAADIGLSVDEDQHVGIGNGLGILDADAYLHISGTTTPQMIITHTNKADSCTFGVDGNGDLTITPTGADMTVDGATGISGNLTAYTATIGSASPYITLYNNSIESSTDGGNLTPFNFRHRNSNGVYYSAYVNFEHDGTGLDKKTRMTVDLNDGDDADGSLTGRLRINSSGSMGTPAKTITLGAGVTTFVVDGNVMTITGDGATNTVGTITGAVSGAILTCIFVDANITITDTDGHTANTVDLVGTATNLTSADDLVLQLVYDGTSWYEISRSAN